jgi:hypothetical protein
VLRARVRAHDLVAQDRHRLRGPRHRCADEPQRVLNDTAPTRTMPALPEPMTFRAIGMDLQSPRAQALGATAGHLRSAVRQPGRLPSVVEIGAAPR